MKSNYLRLQHYATLQETIAADYCRRKKSRDHLVTILDIQTYQIIIADHIVKNVRKWDTVVKNAEPDTLTDICCQNRADKVT